MRTTSIVINFCLWLTACIQQQATPANKHKTDTSTTDRTKPAISSTHYDSSSSRHFHLPNLSRQFNLDIYVNRFFNRTQYHDSNQVTTVIRDKNSGSTLDSLLLRPLLFYSDYFSDTAQMVSYSTGLHVHRAPVDNYIGDLAVADLNFDGRDDLAVLNDVGGSTAVYYNYYIQQPNKKFILDRYLTDSMSTFPSRIDPQQKTLTTIEAAGAVGAGKQVYKIDPATGQWKKTSHELLTAGRKTTH